jgi:drug/metabolite transporter (DMT)-like permease
LFGFIFLAGLYQKIDQKDYKLIILSALFNPFLYFLFENYGLKHSTPTVAAVIIATIPVFSPVVAYLTFHEKLTRVNLAGIFISFSGVMLMLVNRDFTLSVDPSGVFFLFGAVFSALLYSVTLRKLTLKYSALTLVAHQNLIGIVLFLPVFLYFDLTTAIQVSINREIVVAFLLLAVLASSTAFVFFAHSVKLIGISKSNIFSNLIPVFTAIFSYLLSGEVFTLKKVAGIIVVIAGVYLSERTRQAS